MKCHVCASPTRMFGHGIVMGDIKTAYYQCKNCGFVQTDEPYWLKRAYENAITRSDVGMVSRNQTLSTITRAIITAFFSRGKRFLDYGGGYGLFVRMMRDAGYDFYHYDKHCPNLFAQDFEISDSSGEPIELLTAFEIFEHLAEPLSEIQKMLNFSHDIFFSTELVPDPAPQPEQWWYYGLDHGQHVSFYTKRSLSHTAELLGLKLYTNNRNLHLMTKKTLNPLIFKFISRYRYARIINFFGSGRSLIASDYNKITGKQLTL